MQKIEKNTPEKTLRRLLSRNDAGSQHYLRFYSTWLDGYVDEPGLMVVPIDDHQVHRGDAVFEAFRYHCSKFIDLEAHLDRLEFSSRSLSLAWPMSRKALTEVLFSLVEDFKNESLMVRLYLTRGPGGFSTDPRESVGSQLYIVLTRFAPLSLEKRLVGATVGISQVPLKPAPFHGIKSCNYLPNVLMKMEAIARGLDFVIGQSKAGCIAEGPTENILFLKNDGELVAPDFSVTLRGTTLLHCLDLAEKNKKTLGVLQISVRPFRRDELEDVVEAAMIGTTLEVWPVHAIEERVLSQRSTMDQLHQLLLSNF